jgi:hypothetical protein
MELKTIITCFTANFIFGLFVLSIVFLIRKPLRHHGLLFMQAMREYEKDRLGNTQTGRQGRLSGSLSSHEAR